MMKTILRSFLSFALFLICNTWAYAQPAITTISPASSAAGNLITITGTGLSSMESVKFGSIPARILTNSATELTFRVPMMASTSRIRLTSPSGTTLSTSAFPVTRISTLLTYQEKSTDFNSIAKAISKPLVADLNGDGLLDLLVGGNDGFLSHYIQAATNSTAFTPVPGNFNNIDVGFNSAPTITDVDGDGKLDLFIGRSTGTIARYEQQNATTFVFSLVIAEFGAIDVGDNARPAFADIDNNGRLDLIIGNTAGTLSRYEQNSANSTAFTLATANFNSIDIGSNSTPEIADLDGDNLLDLFVGDADGRITHYEQTGASSAIFTLVESRFSDIDVGDRATTSLADLDGDGFLDLLIGTQDGSVSYYEQSPAPAITGISPASAAVGSTITISGTDLSSMKSVLFGGIPARMVSNTETTLEVIVPPSASGGAIRLSSTNGTTLNNSFTIIRKSEILAYERKSINFNSINSPYSKPLFTDTDKDGLLDLLVGGSNGAIARYEQGVPGSSSFVLVNANFSGISLVSYSAPTITDLDGDGLLDLVIGDGNGNLNRFEQVITNGITFNAVTSTFTGIDVGESAKPTFADIDNNGLLDLIIGERGGNLNRYEQSAANSTDFNLVTETFNNIDVGDNSAPSFSDIDGDGLLDLIIGDDEGHLRHYKQAAANSPAFNEVTLDFNDIDVGENAAPAIVDLDGDGWLDLFVGEQTGNINHYEQYVPAPEITAMNDDTGVSISDKITNDTQIKLKGTAFPGVQITISETGLGEVGTGTADLSGDWEVDLNSTLTDGAYTFSAVAADANTNTSVPSADYSITVDIMKPSVAVSTTLGSRTKQAVIPATITFTEDVYNFNVTDLSLINATASNFAGSGKDYTVDINPTANGLVTVNAAAGSGTDNAGNGNIAATALSIIYDTTAPSVPAGLEGTSQDLANRISWTANTESDLLSYNVYSGTTPAPTILLTTIPAGTNVYTHTGLTNGTTYYYRLSSVDDLNNESSLSDQVLSIPKAGQSITITGTISDKTYGDPFFDINGLASSSAGLQVTYSIKSGPASISGTTVSVTAVGTVIVAVNQPGNSSFNSAPEKTTSFNVSKAEQSIAITGTITDKTYGAPSFDISSTASSSSGLPVVYSVKSGPASISGTTLSITGAGTVTVAVNQPGNTLFESAPEQLPSFKVSKAEAVITWQAPADITYGTRLSSVQLNAGSNIAGIFIYSPQQATLLQAGDGQTISVNFIPADTANYNSATATITLNVKKANLIVTADNKSRCIGLANPAFTLTYQGFANQETASAITAPAISSVANNQSPAGSYPILLSGGSAANYSLTLNNGLLSVNPLPVINIAAPNGAVISRGETLTLNAVSDGVSFSWSNAEGIIGGQSSKSLVVRPAATTTYIVTATSATGCTSTQSITVEVKQDLLALKPTNIMSPNGDGINDTWIIDNIDMFPENEVKIFDSAGRLLFGQKSYKNTWEATVNGSGLAEGTYYYIVDFGKDLLRMKGFITIIRN